MGDGLHRNIAAWAAAWGLGLGSTLPAWGHPFAPVGGEFQVNTYTTHYQRIPAVTSLPDGGFVVVWEDSGYLSGPYESSGVQGQRYAADGSKQGAQFQVNTYTQDRQCYASIASDADGDFVVVWQSDGSSGTDTSLLSIQGQRYGSNGSRLGAEFQINTYTTAAQAWPSVAVSPDGDFIVTWDSHGSFGTDTGLYNWSIQGQRYASDGSTRGAQFQVNTYTTGSQAHPSVATAANGDFVVVWESGFSPYLGSGYDIKGQRYASDGSTQGTEFQVNTYTSSQQIRPWAARDAEGNFVVAWTSRGSPETDNSGNSVQGQRYASNGSAQGAQFQINSYTTNDQFLFRSLAVDSDGDFVVTWSSYGSSGTDTSYTSVQGQRFASDGSAQGAQFQVNTSTTFEQTDPSVAMLAETGFIVAWQSKVSSGTDSSNASIQGQRYRTAIPVPALSPSMMIALAAALGLGACLALLGRVRR